MQKKLWYNCIAIIGVMICLITSFSLMLGIQEEKIQALI